MTDKFYLGQAAYYNLRDVFNPPKASGMFAGVPVHSSTIFPYTADCKTCDGTGEGQDSTYCRKCRGTGGTKYEGMVQNGRQTILLTGRLPKKFAPRFPAGLVPHPPLSRGLA